MEASFLFFVVMAKRDNLITLHSIGNDARSKTVIPIRAIKRSFSSDHFFVMLLRLLANINLFQMLSEIFSILSGKTNLNLLKTEVPELLE